MDDLSLISDYSITSLTAHHAYLYKDVQGQMECLNKKGKDIYDFNWVSFNDLEKNCSLEDFPYSATRALMSRRYQYFEKKKTGELFCRNSSRYIGNTIMANLAEFEYARVMTHCGTIGFGKTMNTPCGKWKYCDRCADIKRKFFYLRYSDIYGLTTEPCFFITITVDVEDKVIFTEQNQLKVLDAWNKMNLYVDLMYKKKLIKGAIIVEEAAFDSYYPNPVINPHLHVLCVGTDALHTHRFEGMKIHVKTINNHEHWVNELNYMHKCINFFSPYARDWTVENARTINRNFRDMLNLHKHVVKNRNQSRAIGNFHGKSSNSLVKTTKEIREAFKEKPKKIARQKAKKKIQYNNMFEQFASGARNQLKQYKEKLAVIEADPLAAEPKKEETPWWKNPYILGGGALALGAGAYGAGKLYNGGNNVINSTLGKGVDNYIVNPIKNVFSKPAPKASTPVQSAPAVPTPKPQTTAPAANPETQQLTPQQTQDLQNWIKGQALPSPVIRTQMQSTVNAGKTIPTLMPNPEYRAATEKLPGKESLSPLAGVSPLRPELQKMIGQNTTPFEKYYDTAKGSALERLNKRLGEAGLLQDITKRKAERDAQGFSDKVFKTHFDNSQVIRDLQTRSQMAWNGDERVMRELPEFEGKTPAEVEKIMTDWQKHRQAFDSIPLEKLRELSKGNLPTENNNGHPLWSAANLINNNASRIKGLTAQQGTAPTDLYRKGISAASVPAFAYDMTNLAAIAPPVRNGLAAAGTKLIGQNASNLVGKANPALFPISAAVMNAPAGYNIGQDIANDPTSSYHKLMTAMGIKPENMKYVGSGATAGMAGLGTLATSQASKSALKGLITRSLATGAATGAGTMELSPAVAIPAALTATLAAPIADTVTQRSVGNAVNHTQLGDQLSNFHNNLLRAREFAANNNDGSALRGLLNSDYFKSLDTSSQDGIKRIYDSLGTSGGNLVMAAKHKSMPELVTSKLIELLKFNKFKPAEPTITPPPNVPLGY